MASSSDPKRGSGSSTPAELLTAAFDDATIGMAIIMVGPTPGDDRILRCNYALCSITGHSETVLLEGGLALLDVSSESRQSERLRSTGAGRGRVEFEHSMTTADGNLIWVMITLSTVRQETGGSEYRLLQIQDISDRRDYESRLQFLAGHDPLTGLTNVRRLIEVMDQSFAYQSRYGGDAALLSFDLDNFKAVNDSIGHAEGDRTLKAFAARIKDHSRGADTVARLGGDEFAIFLPGTNLADATSVGNAILADLRKNPVAIGAQGVEALILSASIGATALNGRDDIQAPELILEADAAMYSAKAGGRNQIAPFPVDKPKKMWEKTRLTWVERTRRALDADDLFLDAQPVRRIGTGATAFHEVLLRMNDPEEGIVYPPSFLYTAERFGLSAEIDSWVFKTALAALARSSDTTTQVSINLTGSSLSNSSGFLNEIPQMIKAAGVDSSRIIFELTEQVVISDLERARSFIEEVREIGCRFALDDFGAGFGGFYYLKNLPMDLLKIDGEFVRSLTDSKEDQVIVRAITEMGQGMNLEIVAEYVINAATESLCGDLGVDMAQGSFIGPPVRIEQALGLDQ